MRQNNFDTSTSGENIEFFAYYDVDLASIYFQDFARENTRLDFGRDFTMFLLGNSDAPFYKKSALEKMSKQAIFDLCADYELVYWYESPSKYLKKNLIQFLACITVKQFYENLTNNNGWHSIGEKIEHSFYVSRGYSQGDAVYIVSLEGDLTKAKRQHIDRILWDSPITMRLEVGGLEFFEDSFLTDAYEWDRDTIAEKVKALPLSDYAKSWIIQELPDYPQYN